MTIELKRVVKAELPDLSRLSKTFWRPTGNAIIAGILQNIVKQQQASGMSLKRNAPKTRERKLRVGRRPLSLIDALHRFVRTGSWKILEYLRKGTGVIVGASSVELKQLIKWTSAKGYTGYIGINKEAAAKIEKLLVKEIKRQFKAEERKQQRG